MTEDPKRFKATDPTFRVSADTKFSIMSTDDTTLKVVAQFNPKEFEISKEVPWQPPGDAGGPNTKPGSGGVEMQFTGAKGRTFSIELLFDDTDKERKGDVATNVATLEKLTKVINPKSQVEAERRPHWCVATWGWGLPKLECVITSLKTKYEMFDQGGNPIRARCTISLSEASSVSIKDKNPKPKKPAAPTSGGTGTGGTGTGNP